ncbi:hypothetical protein BaRGS_00031109, partial [Batillaria attramentaria]
AAPVVQEEPRGSRNGLVHQTHPARLDLTDVNSTRQQNHDQCRITMRSLLVSTWHFFTLKVSQGHHTQVTETLATSRMCHGDSNT